MRLLLPLLLLAVAAPSVAQSAVPASSAASAEWGTPVAPSAASGPAPNTIVAILPSTWK